MDGCGVFLLSHDTQEENMDCQARNSRDAIAPMPFPDCLCRLMAYDDVPNMQPCKYVPGGVCDCSNPTPPLLPL